MKPTICAAVLLVMGSARAETPGFEMKTYTYKTVAKLEIQADVYRAPDERVRPVVVWLHGGALIVGSRHGIPQQLVNLCRTEGYVLVSFDYRLAPEVKLPGIIADVKDALRWLREQGPKLFHIDKERIVVTGGSAGGYLTMMTGVCVKPPPRALVTYWGYGDVDGPWYTSPSEFYRTSIPLVSREEALQAVGTKVMTGAEGADGKARGRYYLYLRQNGLWTREVSGFDPVKERRKLDPYCPVRNLTANYPPILMVHGTVDTDVPYEESAAMDRELTRLKLPHELITVPGAGHGLGGGDEKLVADAHERALAFIRGQLAPTRWLEATAHVVPKETATEGEGYFSIIEGHNGRLYIGTHANGVNAWLVEFDPKAERMRPVVDAQNEIGSTVKGFAAQAKIHTRNNVGASGKIYFGTKQGYPSAHEKREDYRGGYPMVYDPETGTTKVYPIPVPYHGINSITPDESRGVAYVSTCSDGRPGPGENSIFLILDLKTGKYRELIDARHPFGFIVVDYLGRAYHPLLGGDIARYDPRTDRLDRLQQTIDAKPPAPESHLADATGHPINWDITPDGKTLYAVAMSTNELFSYDLTAAGATIPGRTVGTLVSGARKTDCRALCVGPRGQVWAAVTEAAPPGIQLLHLVTYRAGEKSPRDLGPVSIKNPDYTDFTDKQGKPLPFHDGVVRMSDGATTSRHVILGVCEGKDGFVNMLMLHPYTVLRAKPMVE